MKMRNGRLPSLYAVLKRVHLRVTLFAVTLSSFSILLCGFAVIQDYAGHNLNLIAQSASYTLEAAAVFDDAMAANEASAPLKQSEEVAGLTVKNRNGRTLVSWQRPGSGFSFNIDKLCNAMLFPNAVVVPIRHDNQIVGEVRVRGNAGGLMRFAAVGTGTILLCLLLTAIGTWLLARHLQDEIIGPLRAIAAVTHSVRKQRAFDRRVAPANIAEIDAFGDDFNALLDDLENWHNRLEAENRSLSHLANHDGLTGLWNRSYFESELSQVLKNARPDRDRIALLYLDADRFKIINDRFGHAAGDAVLIQISKRIRAELRAGDVCARLGGDEFAILLSPRGDSGQRAMEIGRAIATAMMQPIAIATGDMIDASLSIGIATFPEDGSDGADLLHQADISMYLAKQNRNGIQGNTGKEGADA